MYIRQRSDIIKSVQPNCSWKEEAAMLHLIFGMAGAGKTTLLHERIADCVSGGGRAILLVPEQYSFES